MKQDINCATCVPVWRSMIGKYPGEDVKIVEGKALREFRCDSCNLELPKGTVVFAVSVSTSRTPYMPWESGYIEIED